MRTYLIFVSEERSSGRLWHESATIEAGNPETAIRKARTALSISEGHGVAAVPARNWTAVLPQLVTRQPVLKLNELTFGGVEVEGQITIEEAIEEEKADEGAADDAEDLFAEADAELAAGEVSS